jgi:hypothetical protein
VVVIDVNTITIDVVYVEDIEKIVIKEVAG